MPSQLEHLFPSPSSYSTHQKKEEGTKRGEEEREREREVREREREKERKRDVKCGNTEVRRKRVAERKGISKVSSQAAE
jgi:hypothetical protein